MKPDTPDSNNRPKQLKPNLKPQSAVQRLSKPNTIHKWVYLTNTILQATESAGDAILDTPVLQDNVQTVLDESSIDLLVQNRITDTVDRISSNYEFQLTQKDVIIEAQSEQIQLKDAVIAIMTTDKVSIQKRFNVERELRLNAERRVDQLDSSGFKFGIGALAGAVKPLGGPMAPGYGVGFTASYTF